MQLGKNIKLVRTSKNLSQKELATELGITHNYLSMIENDAKTPSLRLIENLCRVLGIPLNTLFSDLSLTAN